MTADPQKFPKLPPKGSDTNSEKTGRSNEIPIAARSKGKRACNVELTCGDTATWPSAHSNFLTLKIRPWTGCVHITIVKRAKEQRMGERLVFNA